MADKIFTRRLFPRFSVQTSFSSTTAPDYNLVVNKNHKHVITPSMICTTFENYTLCTTAGKP
jgi:hypothetical protein